MRFLILCFFSMSSWLWAGPQAIYLTLPDNPTHSISIHWIEKRQKGTFDVLFYQKEGDAHWLKTSARSTRMLGGSSYSVKECIIEGLEESTYYLFHFEDGTEDFLFRTLSKDLSNPMKIALGGDFMESTSLFSKMNKVAAQKNPDFVVLGGDIAYAAGKGLFNGKHGSVEKWVDFFKKWQRDMKGERGRVIPVVAVVGNHDVTAIDRREKGKKALFLDFFPEEQGRTYKSLDITADLSLFLLDSGHLFPIHKKQESWLEESLRLRKNVSLKIPVYHVAAYPSTDSPDLKFPPQIRKYWVPLFEKYGVKLVFEHHNHGYKRTYPLLEEKIDSKGIVYMGDGCWGVNPRKVKATRPYLEKSESSNCFSLLSVGSSFLQVEVFNEENKRIDHWDLKGI